MQYLKELRKTERNENYAHFVGDLRQRVHQEITEMFEKNAPLRREEIKKLICKHLAYKHLEMGGVTQELEYYAEGFVRGLFHDGGAYYRPELPPEVQLKAERHNHLGYSAGLVLRRLREKEGKVVRLK